MKTPVLGLIQKNTSEIAETLLEAKVILLPASTIYGISSVISSESAIERIYDIKSRGRDKPFIVLISNIDALTGLVKKTSMYACDLIREHWEKEDPDQVTMIFEKDPKVEDYVTSGSPKIAIRLEKDRVLRSVIGISGPIVSTSATISGSATIPKSLEDVPDIIKEKVDLIVKSQKTLEGMASTIVDVSGNKPLLLREGGVKLLGIRKKDEKI